MALLLRRLEASDEDLMRSVKDGDTQAFEQLYDRHAARALRVARSVCATTSRAEDAVQEGFLSIWRSRASYRPGSGSFQGWSMRIIRNRAIDSVRNDAAHPRPADGERAEFGTGAATDAPADQLIARSESDALRLALSQLPPAQAEVIALAFFGELTHTEIADQLALPAGTVKGRMRLGLAKLRTQLEDPALDRNDVSSGLSHRAGPRGAGTGAPGPAEPRVHWPRTRT